MKVPHAASSPSSLSEWVDEVARLTRPNRVVWCDGSEDEGGRLIEQAVRERVLIQLNDARRPGCYLHRSHPSDGARTEDATFICSSNREDAGPTNNWMPPGETYRKLADWLRGSMRGRTMYVVPYMMGPAVSEFARVGGELTDSLYVTLSMRIMTRMGSAAPETLGDSAEFNRGLHCTLDSNPTCRLICHFPGDNTVWSVGGGYGGNALLSKKCFALRIAGWLGRKEGWLAEHMPIVGLENPQGETTYVAAAFSSACGETNLAMLTPPPSLNGWRVFTVGDHIAWLRVGKDGRLWAVNPEAGCFGVAPGANERSDLNAMSMIQHDTIFTNVALTPNGDVWREGIGFDPPLGTIDWQGRPRSVNSGQPAAHPNSRFTTPMTNNLALSAHAFDRQIVPISAIIFGGRRATTVPLVTEAFDWKHGVYLGATMGSETTAATGKVGVVRRDLLAMLPFCGYRIADYFAHWLALRPRLKHPSKLFMANWFRKGHDGSVLWRGYGENLRILEWIVKRVAGRGRAQDTPVGLAPELSALNLEGLELPSERLRAAMTIKRDEWSAELCSQEEFFNRLACDQPREIEVQHEAAAAALEL